MGSIGATSDVLATQQAFARLMELERDAARRADVDALLALQEQKRALLPLVHQLPADVITAFGEQAQANLVLMRHLALCLRGIAAPEPVATYTAHGVAGKASGVLVTGVL